MVIEPYQSDIEALRPLLDAWEREVDPTRFGMVLSAEVLLAHLEQFRQVGVILAAVSKEGRILGFMGLWAVPSPLSDETVMEEHLWYVLPEHRSRQVTRLFLDAAEMIGKAAGASRLLLTASELANKEADRVGRLYERFGFKRFETVYIREVA